MRIGTLPRASDIAKPAMPEALVVSALVTTGSIAIRPPAGTDSSSTMTVASIPRSDPSTGGSGRSRTVSDGVTGVSAMIAAAGQAPIARTQVITRNGLVVGFIL
ncbi:hypothetical protein GCM10009102_30310 [Sphingomonas insulae]|uniref:Uncharacterized protein n=1 Tax=Sphingomonas insulae TaxID=424800 RepID=A0ABN1HZJ3_9SPHN